MLKRFFISILLLVSALFSANAQSVSSSVNINSQVTEQSVKSLKSLVSKLYKERKYDEAVQVQLKIVDFYKNTVGTENINYATSLSNLAFFYSYLDNYQEAVRLGTEAMEIEKKVLGSEHSDYVISLSNLALNYSHLGNYQEALRLGTEAMEIIKKVFGTEHPDYATSLNNIAGYYSCLGNYQEAARLGTEAMEIQKKVFGTEDPDYATSLNNLASYYSSLGNYQEAVRIGTEAMEIRKKVLGTEHPDYASSLNNLALYYSDFGNYQEAVRLGTEAMEIQKKVLGTENPKYATSLSSLANYYCALGNYQEAVRLCTEAMEIRKKVLGTEHPDYATSLGKLANYYSDLGNYQEAVRLCTEAMEIRKKVLGTEHPDYATSLGNLASHYSHLGNYQEAVRLGTEAMEILKKTHGTGHPDYATSLNNLASYYSSLGNYQEAVRLCTEAMEIRKKVLGTENPDYAASLDNLASYYSSLGNYQEAVRLCSEAMEIRKKVLGTEHPYYATSLNNLAGYYSDLGNYQEAVRLGTGAMEIRKKVLGTGHPNYAQSLNNLAGYYSDLGNYQEAVRLCTEAMEIEKKVLGAEHPDYASSLNNLALYYSDLGNYHEAVSLGTEAMEIRKKVLGVQHPSYALSLNNLANYYYYRGNNQEAVRLGREAMEIRKKVLGANHPNYARSLNNLSYYYSDLGNFQEATRYSLQSADISQNDILSKFSDMIAYERELYWDKSEFKFNTRLPELLYKSGDNQVAGTVYDKSALFAKGILLSAEMEMARLIQDSGNVAALEKYENLRQNRAMLNKLLETPIAERQMNTDSLQAIVDKQESELVSMSKVYGDYTKNLRLTWKDVQSKLPADGVAVEFLSFPVSEDSTMYIALTLRKDYDMPKMTVLFEQKQLTAYVGDFDGQDVYLPSENLTNLIWQPLADELKGVKKIYFAPSGLLHSIGIEYLPGMEEYSIYRLSSTRELALNRSNATSKGAALYGGIKYDTDINTMLAEARAVKDGRTKNVNAGDIETDNLLAMSSDTRSVVSSMHLRSQASYLPATKTEVEDVNAALKGNAVGCTIFTGSNATEETFKALGGKHTKILHIATHGFYYTPEEADNNSDFKFLQLHIGGDNERRYVEDKAMTRSGLLFAGANNALGGEDIPDGLDDGILTAKEISQIDLRGLDLVTLSACQTGLGDISQGEGVFGLQRAFKKAGAQTIVVSLWKVDDKATQILMSSFYSNIAKGIDKHSAFQQAQQHLRAIDGGRYNDPKYWAAFIILDATE